MEQQLSALSDALIEKEVLDVLASVANKKMRNAKAYWTDNLRCVFCLLREVGLEKMTKYKVCFSFVGFNESASTMV